MTDALASPSGSPARSYDPDLPFARYLPGLFLAFTLAAAASYLSEQVSILPAMLVALAIGMALSSLSDDVRFAGGIRFSAQGLLRIGVALLGVRVSLGSVAALGWALPLATLFIVGSSMVVGYHIARWRGLSSRTALLTAGGVSICGASAILAISSMLPDERRKDEAPIVVAAITIVGTIAMLVYPMIGGLIGISRTATAIFVGGSIHEVAQVTAAASMLPSAVVGIAITIKLLRVACLAPILLFLRFLKKARGDAKPPAALPLFVLGFIAFAAVASFNVIPPAAMEVCGSLSRWCLLTAMAAIGTRTAPRHLRLASLNVLITVIFQTMFLTATVLAVVAAGSLGATP